MSAAAEHGHLGAPERFAVSKDGTRMAAVYKDGRFTEIAVEKALQTSAAEHLDRMASPDRVAPQPTVPAAEVARTPEPSLAR